MTARPGPYLWPAARVEPVARLLPPACPPLRITLSVGLVPFPRDGSNETVLLTRAQRLLGEAAHSGGNRVAKPK